MRKKGLQVTGYVLAVTCLGYFTILMATIGPAFHFSYVWLVMGLFFLGISLVLTFSKRGFQWMPKPLLAIMELVVLIGCLFFVVVESLIVYQSVKLPKSESGLILYGL